MTTALEQAALSYAAQVGWSLGGTSSGPVLPPAVDCLAGTPPSFLPAMMPTAQDIGYYNTRCAYFDRQQPEIKSGSVLFLGDSHFDGFVVSNASPFAVNQGIGGDTLRGLLNRLNRGSSSNPIHRAGCVVLLIGVNDIAAEGANYTTNIPYMLDMISAWITGKWVICKLLPVTDGVAPSTLSNAKIDVVNQSIASKLSGRPGIALVDVKSTLAPSGQLLSSYSIDGLHLNASGYDVLSSAIAAGMGAVGIAA